MADTVPTDADKALAQEAFGGSISLLAPLTELHIDKCAHACAQARVDGAEEFKRLAVQCCEDAGFPCCAADIRGLPTGGK
jgi:hypothetical protein